MSRILINLFDVSFEGNGTITVRDPKNDEDREIPLSQSVRKVLQERKAGPVVDLKYVFGTSGDILQQGGAGLFRGGKERPFAASLEGHLWHEAG